MTLSPSTRAALWMLLCSSSFGGTLVCIRQIGHLGAVEIVLFRTIVAVVLLAPWLAPRSRAGFPRGTLVLYFGIGVFLLIALAMWNWVVNRMPLADGTALNFTLPLFGTAFAVIFLKEPLTRARVLALLAGFAGVLVILRPGWIAITGPALAALGCAAAFAAANIIMKFLVRTVPADVVTFNFHLLLLPLALIASLPDWTTPSLADLPWAIGIGVFGTTSYIGLMRAFALADASACMAYDFMRLPFAAVIGAALFGEAPDVWTWLGAAIIFGAAYTATRAEARAARTRAGVAT
jgi:S-adenosylmethionine uptake transporter